MNRYVVLGRLEDDDNTVRIEDARSGKAAAKLLEKELREIARDNGQAYGRARLFYTELVVRIPESGRVRVEHDPSWGWTMASTTP